MSVELGYIGDAKQNISCWLHERSLSPELVPNGNGIFTYFTGCHHHTSTDGVERIRSDTGTGGHSPAE